MTKQYFYFCNNCFHVNHFGVSNNTHLNINMRCGCGHLMNKTIKIG